MQNVEEYNRNIHTFGQAAGRARSCCTVFGIRIGSNLLDNLHRSISFILGLQTHNLILKAYDGEPFFMTQFAVITILIVVTVVFSYIQGEFTARYERELDIKTGGRYVHGFYQS